MMVSTWFLFSHCAIALSSRLLAPLTAASSVCQVAYDAAACSSTEVSGSAALAALSWYRRVYSAATGPPLKGGSSSKVATPTPLHPPPHSPSTPAPPQPRTTPPVP